MVEAEVNYPVSSRIIREGLSSSLSERDDAVVCLSSVSSLSPTFCWRMHLFVSFRPHFFLAFRFIPLVSPWGPDLT